MIVSRVWRARVSCMNSNFSRSTFLISSRWTADFTSCCARPSKGLEEYSTPLLTRPVVADGMEATSATGPPNSLENDGAHITSTAKTCASAPRQPSPASGEVSCGPFLHLSCEVRSAVWRNGRARIHGTHQISMTVGHRNGDGPPDRLFDSLQRHPRSGNLPGQYSLQ